MRYCGRDFSIRDIELINDLMTRSPEINRAQLSREFCRESGWLKLDGGLKEMACRVAMLKMERDGLIELPTAIHSNRNGHRVIKPSARTDAPENGPAIDDFLAVSLNLPEGKSKESGLWNEFVHRYHYLGYTPLPGSQLRYFIEYNGIKIGGPQQNLWAHKRHPITIP